MVKLKLLKSIDSELEKIPVDQTLQVGNLTEEQVKKILSNYRQNGYEVFGPFKDKSNFGKYVVSINKLTKYEKNKNRDNKNA